LLYVAVSAVLVAMVPYTELNVSAPMAVAMDKIGAPFVIRLLVDVGAVLGLGSVVLVMLLGQSRVFYSMSRDGLIGSWGSRVHPKFRTPYLSTIFTGVAVTVAAGILPLDVISQLVNIGTLLAFVLVCIGVMVLRKTRPDLDRPFRTPWVPLVPILGVICCFGLMLTLPGYTWLRLIVWLIIGLVIYFTYGRRHSKLQLQREAAGR
jgi:APA family basic amino acid/polyamine antiporter